ncbi:unnamed protein product, partial [Closterium sp. NIES-53]
MVQCIGFGARVSPTAYNRGRCSKDGFPFAVRPFSVACVKFWFDQRSGLFPEAMNDVFRDAISQFILVYLDDILVYSKTEDEHTEHLKWVLGKLREHKYYARLWKCHFYKRELEYLV